MSKCLSSCAALALFALVLPPAFGQGDEVAALVKKLSSAFDKTAGANGLAKLGGKARSAISELGKAMHKAGFQEERVAMAKALEAIVTAIRTELPDLRAELKAAKGKEKDAVSAKIDAIRSLSRTASDDLGEMLIKGKAAFSDDRMAVTKAIAVCGEDAAGKGVQGLAAALKGGFMANQIAAANALGQLGATAREAIPALNEAAKAGFLDVRKAASEALKKIGK